MQSIRDLSPTGILFLTTITIVSFMSQVGNGSSAFEEIRDKCLILLLGNVCDFFLVKRPCQIRRILHTCLIILP